jgi:hypothetical protein
MKRIGTAVAGLTIIAVGGFLIVSPEFVDLSFWHRPGKIYGAALIGGLMLLAIGVVRLVNGIEGYPHSDE